MESLIDPVTQQEHLREQLVLSGAEGRVRDLAELLIGNIDDSGYLQATLSEVSLANAVPIKELKRALELVQSFEPAGVGATDLRECLLLQLERQGRGGSLEARIVSKHLEDLAKHRYPQVARKLGVGTEQVARAAEAIAALDPRPGQAFGVEASPLVTPDVTVARDGDGWAVTLNDDRLPQLRISNLYKDLMAQTGNGDEVRSYIRDKIRSGKFLIKSIHQRQQTIQGIANEIVKRQEPFLEHGSAHLVPMTMAQVADAVGVHETTVSRAVSGKYIATPHGVFEMKYFFTHGIQTDSGQALSNTSVKGAIAELVKSEDTSKPYSDEQLVVQLKKKGIRIARRTVAKYREELNILPSHLRRGY
jgi:RNA polymerase sigma-54 factor